MHERQQGGYDGRPGRRYCDDLDKEMTIMGLLTAFAVAVPALAWCGLSGPFRLTEETAGTTEGCNH